MAYFLITERLSKVAYAQGQSKWVKSEIPLQVRKRPVPTVCTTTI